VVLGPKQAARIVIRCGFEPERLVADPDFRVLQLERPKATAKVELGPGLRAAVPARAQAAAADRTGG